mmetsp:Transcript_4422/g.10022  ORF Transcript_4422/g.10022 Transcript_4422/m.10022 type:complete len:164 (-) Transcript_4422:209-700(-)
MLPPPHNNVLTKMPSSSSCSVADPCGTCTGDCDTDEDCYGSLVCYQRGGSEPVPGCEGTGTSGTDYCLEPPVLHGDSYDYCSSSQVCGRCAGDCDSHRECAGDLVCFSRSGTEPVPGCSGKGISGYGYCIVVSTSSISGSKESLSIIAAIGVASLAIIAGACF